MARPSAGAEYERILEHCVAITGSIELGDVVGATLDAMADLLSSDTRALVCEVDKGEIRVLGGRPPARRAVADELPLGAPLLVGAVTERSTVY